MEASDSEESGGQLKLVDSLDVKRGPASAVQSQRQEVLKGSQRGSATQRASKDEAYYRITRPLVAGPI